MLVTRRPARASPTPRFKLTQYPAAVQRSADRELVCGVASALGAAPREDHGGRRSRSRSQGAHGDSTPGATDSTRPKRNAEWLRPETGRRPYGLASRRPSVVRQES